MGVQMRPCSIFITSVLVSCVLIGVGIIGYHLKVNAGKVSANVLDENNLMPRNETLYGEHGTKSKLIEKCVGPDEKCNIRLDPNVLPVHYDLYLFPNITAGDFTGHVTISLDIQNQSVDHIRLHIKYLEILSTELKFGGTDFPVNGYENDKLEYWVVKSAGGHLITKGQYELKLSFRGNLTRGIIGFYRSSYFDKSTNTSKYVVSSKFQSTYARRAFPCFDEPGFKSTFTLTIVKPSDLVALSNMPIEEEVKNSPQKELTTVKFQKSVPMVTYLLAFAIGEFAYKESHTKQGVPVRIYSTSFLVDYTQYASNITANIVDYFEDYFGIPYPLPKLDVVGIPDFVSGAMEHWGMISFRESNLLYQPGVASAFNKQRIAAVLGHELAHMWFGNLMTLKWWNDLWLNEGFASYMEYKGVNAVHPDWEIETQFVGDDLTPILKPDGQHSSHPIVQDVSNPSQITELFDKISYSKGASVIRMLENFMGKESFRRGVQLFLKKFSFKNAVTSDLWEELQASAGPLTPFNISLVMDTWTRQMGYPVLTPLKNQDGSWILKQERFLDNPNSTETSGSNESPFGYKWEVPVGLEWSSANSVKESKLIWMRHDSDTLKLPVDNDFRWIKLNQGQYGYYRVKYNDDMYKRLKTEALADWLPTERCGALDDAFSLAFSSYLEYNVTLDFAQVLRHEEHFIPWDCSNGHLTRLGHLLKGNNQDAYVIYRKYVISLVTGVYGKLAWTDSETDKHLDRLLKPMIFALSCDNGHTPCLDKTKQLFDRWISNPKAYQVPSGLRDSVYKWGIYQSDSESWQKLWNIYLDEADPQERVRLLRALAFTNEPYILRMYLQLAKNESYVKRQDFFTVVKFMCNNPVGNPIVWEFYRNEYKYMLDRFTLQDRYFGRVILDITGDYSTDIQLREVLDFFEIYPDGGAGARARESALENVRNNIAWAARNAPVIEKWLRGQTFSPYVSKVNAAHGRH